MPMLNEPVRNTAFLLSEGKDYYSRDQGTIDATGGALASGTVLGKITASGTFVRHDPAAVDGSEIEAGILFLSVPAELVEAAVIARHAQVDSIHLIYADGADTDQIDATNAALGERGILAR